MNDLIMFMLGVLAASLFWPWFIKKAALRHGVAEIDPKKGWQWKDVAKLENELRAQRNTRIVYGNFYKGIEWFACWLLDHVEGEEITEEQLRPWSVEAWNAHLKQLDSHD